MSLTVTIKEARMEISFPGTLNESIGNAVQDEVVRLQAVFKNFAGSLIDPTGVSFYVMRESDSNFTFYMYGTGEIVRSETGVYYLDIDTAAESGNYLWRVLATSYSAKQGSFYIEPEVP